MKDCCVLTISFSPDVPPERRSSNRSQSTRNGDFEGFPEKKPWPDIPMKAITDVCNGILDQLSTLDPDGLFAIPVIEQLPELEDDYIAQIESPMDFRTIEEERLPTYEHIRALQDDLILVFRNCATFNDSNSEIHSFAV
jgi:hypothetical protein